MQRGVSRVEFPFNSPVRATNRARPPHLAMFTSSPDQLPVWPAVLLFYCLLFPEEVRLPLGDFMLYIYRLVLFSALPFILSAIFSGKLRLGFLDSVMIAAGLWMVGSMISHLGLGQGLESGGAVAFDVVIAYFVGRCFLRSPGQLRRFLEAILPGVAILSVVFLLESISHSLLIRPPAAEFFGTAVGGRGDAIVEIRYGLARAYGPFPHPIAAGLVMASLLPLYWLSLWRSKSGKLGSLAALAAFFTMSSAGFVSLAINIVSLITDWAVRRSRQLTWTVILCAVLLLAFLVQFSSKSGLFSVIIRYLTLDPGTGFHRLLIWEYGSAAVMRSPLLGLGFGDWVRPAWLHSNSVDAHWLALSMQFGLPVGASLLFVSVASISLLGKRRDAFAPPDSKVAGAVAFSLTSMVLMMFTVTLWNNAYSWFCLLLGCAVGLGRTAVSERKRRSRVSAFVAGTPSPRVPPGDTEQPPTRIQSPSAGARRAGEHR